MSIRESSAKMRLDIVVLLKLRRIVGFITTFFTRDTAFMLMAVNENAHDNKPVKLF